LASKLHTVLMIYTVSQKTRQPTHVDNYAKKLIDFQDSFTDRLRTKFSTK